MINAESQLVILHYLEQQQKRYFKTFVPHLAKLGINTQHDSNQQTLDIAIFLKYVRMKVLCL
jgi:hypothetical protein